METGDAATSLRAVFSWSYQLLSEPAARAFRLLGLHPGPDFTTQAVASLAAVPLAESRTLMRELARYNLVTEHGRGRFAFHDMLRVYAAEQAGAREGSAECRAAVHRLLEHYLLTGQASAYLMDPTRSLGSLPAPAPGVVPEQPQNYQQAWAWLEAEQGVLLAAVNQSAHEGFNAHAWQIPWTLETFFIRKGRWHDMIAVYGTALQSAEYLGDVAGQAHIHSGLGRTHALLGANESARSHLSKAIGLFSQIPEGRTGEARALINMGSVWGRQGRYGEALEYAAHARDLYQAAGHQAGYAGATNNIGWYNIHLGRNEEALALCDEAFRTFRQVGSLFGVAHALDSLACAHLGLGQHDQAMSLCLQSYQAFVEIGDRYAQAQVLDHLGDAYDSSGDSAAARDTWQQALSILDDLRHSEAGVVRAKLPSGGKPPTRSYG
jgi:tetratricopeptide (TPR) repeat protein